MSVFQLVFRDGFGCQLFQYAFAKAYCEKYGFELQTPRTWVGRTVFGLNDPAIEEHGFPLRDDESLVLGECNVSFTGLCANDKFLLYSLEQVRNWFKLKPGWDLQFPDDKIIAHRRLGDYRGGKTVIIVTRQSYLRAARRFNFKPEHVTFIEKENAQGTYNCMQDIPDFIRMMKAPVLFRGNSTFSWWAATLGQHRVFSPIVDGMFGGGEQDCEFAQGNWPKISMSECAKDWCLT